MDCIQWEQNIWYKERSSEEYNEWFEKFDFPKQLDILSELYPIWLYIKIL